MRKAGWSVYKGGLLILVAMALVAFTGGQGSSWYLIRGPSSEGDVQMVDDFPYQYVPVPDTPTALKETLIAKASHLKPPVDISGEAPVAGRPLSEVAGQVEPLLVPSYLPEGFTYDRAFVGEVSHPQAVNPLPPVLMFSGPAEGHATYLNITAHELPPKEVRPVQAEIKEGAFERVSVKSGIGYLIRGSWAASVDASTGSISVGWDENAALSVIFVRDDRAVEVMGTPASAFSEEELIRVAESPQPY